MALKVIYPSGRRFEIEGSLKVIDVDSAGLHPAIDSGSGELTVLDPRGIVLDNIGGLLYSPRQHPIASLGTITQSYLIANPTWGVTEPPEIAAKN